MAVRSINARNKARPGRRGARRLVAAEAYRRIAMGNVPETLSDFAAQLSIWFKDAYPASPPATVEFIEDAIRDTWHRRHEEIGSEL
jgi:hypothetical protein